MQLIAFLFCASWIVVVKMVKRGSFLWLFTLFGRVFSLSRHVQYLRRHRSWKLNSRTPLVVRLDPCRRVWC